MKSQQAGQKRPLTLSTDVWQDVLKKDWAITVTKKSRIMLGSRMSNGMRLKKEN